MRDDHSHHDVNLARARRPNLKPGLIVVAVLVTLAVLFLGARPTELLDLSPPRLAEESLPTRKNVDREPGFMLGNYGSAINRPAAAGQVAVIDIQATISALKAASVTTYAYLICPDQTGDPRVSTAQFEALPSFAAAAEVAGIDVYVYLVPPTEADESSYAPYGWDYVGWGQAIGELAVTAASIKGIAIDDFGGNTLARAHLRVRFTPHLVEQMMGAARKRSRHLEFVAVLYHHDLVGPRSMLGAYRHLIQRVIFPYFGSTDGRTQPGNTFDPTLAAAQGAEAAGLLKCPRGGTCQQIQFDGGMRGLSRPRAAFTGDVIPRPNEKRIVTVYSNDDAGTASAPGYHFEVVVDGTVAGSALPGHGWTTTTFDITAITSGRPRASVSVQLVPSPSARTSLTLQVAEISVSGVGTGSRQELEVEAQRGVVITDLSDVELIFMTYATPLSSEGGRGASPAYVQQVLQQVDSLWAKGLIDGSMIFQLPLPNSQPNYNPSNYWLVARIYAEWAAR